MQVLRAVAALLVVAYHAIDVWHVRISPEAAGIDWPNGSAGVDVFFVISGLVMVVSSERLRGRGDGWRVFLRHRFVRVLPLYWLATLLKLGAVATAPALALRTRLDWDYVASSFLLVPVHDASGNFRPVLPVGWTLSFEMLFYGLFALALALKVPPLRFVTPILAVLALAAFAHADAWPAIGELANTIVLEFALGGWIGALILRGRVASRGYAGVLVVAGFAALLLMPSGSAELRLLAWGVPATAIVVGTVGLERVLAPHLPGWMLELGDASYAIYLTHGFILPLIGIVVARCSFGSGLALPITIVAGLAASALVGVAVHRVVEKPLLALFRRNRLVAVG